MAMSVVKAADMETLEVQFETLLGSADKAKARIKELVQFAAKTPFEIPEVVNASRQLEVMTKGALSTGDGLRMVGDVASGTGMQFDEAAMWIGRMYDALKNNRPAGEALMRLQEVGVISGETRGEIERLVKSGAGAQAWDTATAALNRYKGGMEKLAATFMGKISNLKDSIGSAFRNFGKPILDALKEPLDALIKVTDGMAGPVAALGDKIASGFKIGIQMLKDGTLMSYLGEKITEYSAIAGNNLLGALEQLPKLLGDGAIIFLTTIIPATLRLVTSAGLLLSAAILRGMEPAIEGLAEVLSQIPGIDIQTRDLFGESKTGKAAAIMEGAGTSLMSKGVDGLFSAFAQVGQSLAEIRADFRPSNAFDNQVMMSSGKAGLYEDQARKNLKDGASKVSDTKSAELLNGIKGILESIVGPLKGAVPA
jgi:hypothetical protein